jgi:putative ABC transport system substrate-binding protein
VDSSVIGRRTLLGVLAGAAFPALRVAAAQPARKAARIGVLTVGYATADMVGPQPRSATVNALVQGLRDLGYVYGEHFTTEARGGGSQPERFSQLVSDLVRSQVDVIVAPGPMLSTLKGATSAIPVVMAGALDPVNEGLIKSLRQPGGNFTGFSLQSAEAVAKRLELLRELVPPAALVAVLWEQTVLSHWKVADATAQGRGWKLLPIEVRDTGEIEGAVRAAAEARAGGLLVLAGGILYPQTRRIAESAAKSRLPAVYSLRPQVEAGGLMSFGADIVDTWRRAAVFVDKILKGANPAYLPVEQPLKFELVVNLRAAKAIDLALPQSVLSRSDAILH